MMKRDECLRVLAAHVTDEIVIAVYASAFDWLELAPRELNYFAFGAMGLAAAHGLGFALGNPRRRVIVLDGDGSLLMNLGTLVTIAAAAPANLVHFVCRNGTYEANGGHRCPIRRSISTLWRAPPATGRCMISRRSKISKPASARC
jgi:sulfopyruvate decarboxylase subunit beta